MGDGGDGGGCDGGYGDPKLHDLVNVEMVDEVEAAYENPLLPGHMQRVGSQSQSARSGRSLSAHLASQGRGDRSLSPHAASFLVSTSTPAATPAPAPAPI